MNDDHLGSDISPRGHVTLLVLCTVCNDTDTGIGIGVIYILCVYVNVCIMLVLCLYCYTLRSIRCTIFMK